MSWHHRLGNLIRGRKLERDIDREFAFHMAEKIDELIAEGMAEADARRHANRMFGNRTLHHEQTRDTDIHRWLESTLRDLGYGVRMMRKSPMFTAVVVLSLAVGIGTTTSLFGLLDALFMRPLPVERPDELVRFKWAARSNWMAIGISGVTNTDPKTHETTSTSFSYATFQRFREQTQSLSDVFAFVPLDEVSVSAEDYAGLADGQLVSGNYFTGLRVRAAIGRLLSDDDDRQANPVAVISDQYWKSAFGGQNVIGKNVLLNGLSLTIVGVASPGFVGAEGFAGARDIFVPMSLQPRLATRSRMATPWQWWVPMMGRMKPGVETTQVQAELESTFLSSGREAWSAAPASARQGHDSQVETPRLLVLSGRTGLADNVSSPFQIVIPMVAIAGVLLLIVCLNVANLLLARITARTAELSVRLAIGGSRFRVVRQLLTEVVLMSAIGGVLGIAVARWNNIQISSVFTALTSDLRIDFRVLFFTAFLAVFCGVIIGLVPALRSTQNLANGLNQESRSIAAPNNRIAKVLLVTQIGLSMVLLVGAGLFVRTVQNLRRVDTGFDTTHLVVFRINPSAAKYDNPRIADLYERTFDRIRRLPGVRGVTSSSFALAANSGDRGPLSYASLDVPGQRENVNMLRVRPNFFQVLGVPVMVGRDLGATDTADAPHVAVINETMARRVFGNLNPIGQRLGPNAERRGEIEIVGVTRDVSVRVARSPIPPAIYVPDQQYLPGAVTFEVRTSVPPDQLFEPIKKAMRQVDPNIPVLGLKTQEKGIEEGFAIENMFAKAGTFFGGVALILVSVGLFGLMSYAVERRKQEIGIRIALGANRLDVMRVVLGQTALLVFTGLMLGTAASIATSSLLAHLPYLFGVSPYDPLTLVGAGIIMCGVAGIASYSPTYRATRVDPVISLRH